MNHEIPRDIEPLRDILHRAVARYLLVKPRGIVTDAQSTPKPVVDVRIVAVGAARTLYKKRRPDCRSLDGISSVTHPKRECSTCDLRGTCTPQVRLDLYLDVQPFRLLLAHTSARNFLAHHDQLKKLKRPIERGIHRITIVDRGTWGELRFALAD